MFENMARLHALSANLNPAGYYNARESARLRHQIELTIDPGKRSKLEQELMQRGGRPFWAQTPTPMNFPNQYASLVQNLNKTQHFDDIFSFIDPLYREPLYSQMQVPNNVQPPQQYTTQRFANISLPEAKTSVKSTVMKFVNKLFKKLL